MCPGRALLLPFDSCHSLYGYRFKLAGIVLPAILQEYIYTYSVVVIMSVHVVKVGFIRNWY